ncbi:MAG: hypothetical protein ACRC6E_02820, partial [Fusobacteriaceae bacterium]
MIGDGDTYFKFHPIDGAKFVGDFVIGESNKNSDNDLWQSLQKNKTFHLDIPPKTTTSYKLREGDIWYDTNDENHVYRYNGEVWVSCRDASIISTQSSTFVQPEPPVATVGRPLNDGDTWYDSDDKNKPYVYKDGKWINVTDMGLSDAIDAGKQQAEGMLSILADIASDGKLTASEKQQTKKEWDIIQAEYPLNVAKAKAYGVTTTEYDSKYSILKTYIEPLLSSLESTSTVDGTVFRQRFSDYYSAEMVLTGDVYEKVRESAVTDSKAYADLIDTKVESYASDGVLTLAEKADLKSEVETVESVSATVISRATLFGVVTTTLTSYVTVLTGWKIILSQTGNYSDKTQITKLRTDFKNYYSEEEKVLDGITKKAKELADNAQSDANGALGLLADIASDGKLTASEKLQTKKEWEIIQGEYPKVTEEATKFGVVRTNYTNAYNMLSSYITPLLASLSITSDIVGATFRANFRGYYDNRQEVLNSISDKITQIGSMQTGKMLYLDPTFKDGSNGINVYNNSGNGLITQSLMTGESFGYKPPNDTNKVLTISKTFGDTSPSMGGFFFGAPTRAGAKLLTKIVAFIPVGYRIMWASNPTGDNSKNYWVTEQLGVGEFREYVHVLECGKTGSFSSTAFFYLEALDGNQSKAVVWGLSYATVFDADANQNDYLTTALGNAKIFYSATAPTGTMKTNDMWYDTDDGNHPYIYNGTIWISARDKIFETEGGNKVYFQTATPPTSGVGIKDGDMWFKTDENNKMFILVKGVWTLADDAMDSIEQGRVVINANTTFNGDATFVSKGSNETTVIKDGSITFTRGGIPVTVIRNMRSGSISTDSNGSGIVRFTNMKSDLTVLPSIQSFSISQNIRSLHCRAEIINSVTNDWRFILGGTEAQIVGNNQTVTVKEITKKCVSLGLSKINISNSVMSNLEKEKGGLDKRWDILYNVEITYFDGQGGVSVVHNSDYVIGWTVIRGKLSYYDCGRDNYLNVYDWTTSFKPLEITINKSFSTFNLTDKTLRIKTTLKKCSWQRYNVPQCSTSATNTGWIDASSAYPFSVYSADINYSTETSANLIGNGVVTYLALE